MASVAELLLAQGRQRANERRARGEVSAQLLANLSSLAGQTIQTIQAQRRDAQQQARIHQLFSSPDTTPEQILEAFGPEEGPKIINAIVQMGELQIKQQPKPAEPFTLSPGQQRFGPDGTPIAGVPVPPKEPEPFTLSPGQQRFGPDGTPIALVAPEEKPDTRSLQQQANDAARAGNWQEYKRLLKVMEDTGRAGRAPEGPKSPGSFEQQIADALAKGDTATVQRLTQAAELASGARARTQGRPVVSGDAGKIADLDTSLDDLFALRGTLSETKDATGTMAALGAGVWTPITNLTGWGTDAKKRQGVIDRVKQVIGKALEGGVLRKEDEYKYEKILPTIKDSEAVATSKLNGLETALRQRRQTLLDSLQDAGYDVSKYSERAPHGLPNGGAPRVGDIVTVKGRRVKVTKINPDGTYEGVPQ